MKTLNHLLFLGFIFFIPKISFAQFNSDNVLISNDQVASLSTHNNNGHKPVFIAHYNKVNNIPSSDDTLRYVLVVDATAHLTTEDKITSDVVDTADQMGLRKMNISTSLKAALVQHDILFDYNDYRLTNSSKNLLDKAAAVMLQYPKAVFEIGGHADARGIYKDNLLLTERRVEAAIDYLVSLGVSRTQLLAVAYGETVLKNVCDSDSYCSEEVHASNRRIEIRVISAGK